MNNNQQLIDGLRACAAFLENHPSFPQPLATRLDVFTYSKDEFQALVRELGGFAQKRAMGDLYFITRDFGGIALDINISRGELCERIVATRIVPAEPEIVIAAKPEREEEVVEWKCPEGILQ